MFNLAKIYRLFFVVVLLVHGSALAQDAGTSGTLQVDYDRLSDRVMVRAEETQLKLLLKQIAAQSGIEVMFDDMADETVSVELQADSLERGLKQLLKGKNYLLRYRDGGQKFLIGVMVLPSGTEEGGRRDKARRVVSMDDEAFLRARSYQPTLEQVRQRDLTLERWQTRLNELPAEKRQALLDRLDKRLKRQAMQKQEWKEREARHKKALSEQRAARERAFDNRWSAVDPAEKEAFKASQQKYNEQVRQQLNSQQPNNQ
jgi:hypothetical protein